MGNTINACIANNRKRKKDLGTCVLNDGMDVKQCSTAKIRSGTSVFLPTDQYFYERDHLMVCLQHDRSKLEIKDGRRKEYSVMKKRAITNS